MCPIGMGVCCAVLQIEFPIRFVYFDELGIFCVLCFNL